MFLLHFIIIITTIACQGTTEEKIPIIISSEGFSDEAQEAVKYEKSIPLTYIQITHTNVIEYKLENNLGVGKYCKQKNK